MMNNIKYKHLQSKSIKLIIFTCTIIGLFTIIKPALSQIETQSDSSRQIADSTIQYITPLEYAFMMHEETSWLFKASILLNMQHTGRLYGKIGIEKRIAPSFTIDLSVDQFNHEIGGDHTLSNGIKTSLESRWYYRLNKRVKENKVARNMSDNYFALGFDYTHLFKNKDIHEYWQPEDYNYLTMFVKWGLQRRFLKHGHADLGIKVGMTNSLNNSFSPSLAFSTYVDFGLAFTKDKYKLDYEKLCPVMKCYESTNHIFKSNLSSLFKINFERHNLSFNISPHLAFERKIGDTPFSFNTEIQAIYSYSKLSNGNKEVAYSRWYWSTELLLEARYYYNLNRRIMNGKTGNGLSANYIALGGSYKYEKEKYYDHGYLKPDIYISTGWQRVFGKHFYFDVNIGLEYNFEVLNSYGGTVQGKGLEPRIRIAVGYRF